MEMGSGLVFCIAYTLDAMGNRVQEQVSDPSNVLTQTRARVYRRRWGQALLFAPPSYTPP
jgi:hypothetical protein